MAKDLYTLRNYAALPLHYAMTAGIAAGAYMMGNPWAIGIASTLTLATMAPSLWLSKEVMEKHMEEHPNVHPYSPHLGEIVRGLYLASGLKAEKMAVYSFTPTKNEPRPFQKRASASTSDEESVKDQLINTFKDAMRSQAGILNASAMRFKKSVIMISEPMLKLLNDEEEKAVLAHEFAHAAAHHVVLSMPVKILNAVSRGTAGFTSLFAAFSIGFWPFVGTVVGVAGAGALIKKIQGDKFKSSDKDSMTVPEIHRMKQLERHRAPVMATLGLAAFSLQNPAYASIWLAAKGINIGTQVTAATLSRSKEYQADRGATRLGASPLALMTSLRKISFVYNESIQKAWGNTPVPKPGFLRKAWKQATSTHPTLDRRLERLADIARKNGFSEDDIKAAQTGPLNIGKHDDIPFEIIREAMSNFVERLDSQERSPALIP